jgi:hypothetical protein
MTVARNEQRKASICTERTGASVGQIVSLHGMKKVELKMLLSTLRGIWVEWT